MPSASNVTSNRANFQHSTGPRARAGKLGPTERQLVQELIDTSWRINRVPALDAEVLSVEQVSDLRNLATSKPDARETETRDLKRAARSWCS